MATFQFIPGVLNQNNTEDKLLQFRVGQFLGEDNEVNFVHGQVVHSKSGSKFVEGETISTADGIKFVAGLTINGVFLSGTIIDEGGESSRFVTGQMISDVAGEEVLFIPGEMGTVEGREVFVPGQRVDGTFRPGQMIERSVYVYGEIILNTKGQVQFLPGIYSSEEDEEFVPGIICETSGSKETVFVEGRLYNNKESETLLVPGQTTAISGGTDNRFEKAKNNKELRTRKSLSPPPLAIDGEALSLVYKRIKPKNGTMLMTQNGVKFFPDGSKIPQELLDSGAEVITGRMECTENGPQFVPGKVMEIHGIRTFIPGRMIKDEESGHNVFVPGKMIDGKNGPRFVPGQVIESEDGDEKFIPGQIMDTPEDGTKFVPGQIIDTKSGPVFIPGQVIRTDNGLKFVPGLIVETSHGALFVPGQVIDAPEGARFVPGHVVDTPEGPRLLPPDVKGDSIDLDYVVQGFDINQIEARLILGGKNDTSDVSDILGGIGGASIGGEALRALAEGFQSRKGNAIITIGEGEDVDKLLQDEMLDSCDSPAVRTIVRSVFLAVFAELCQRIDEIVNHMNAYISGSLQGRLDSTLLSAMKLNPALEALKRHCEQKNSAQDPEEYDILNLVAGIITCSVPGALKECCSDEESSLEESKFKSILLSCIEDSIIGILEEDGIISNGLLEDIKELVKLAKELEFDENQSFFAKVGAVTEGRCNSKFMDTLLKNLRSATSDLGTSELLARLINILAPRLHLQSGFREMCSSSPEFVQEVLNCLKGDPQDIEGYTAIDILHHAITKVINNRCQRQLDDVVHKVELDGLILEKDQDIRSLLEQAIGLAKYMGKSGVVENLFELLGDPIRLEAIRDDPVIKDVLNKILLMQRLTATDSKKRQKLEKLQRYHHLQSNDDDEYQDEDDSSLRELIRICEALTRPPNQGNLKKSKSMVKKSKSMIMTAKDIPMNAFMAMKNSAAAKDEKWLQNFLSESLVEEIPWECSKALIILKQGYQAIIPREASRSILLGEASYTLIDDTGVEFYLSPKDKQKRRKQGLNDAPKKVTLLEEPQLMEEYHIHRKQRSPAPLITEEQVEAEFESMRPKQSSSSNFLEPQRSYGDLQDDFDDQEYSKRKFARRQPAAYMDELDDEDATMASLEKYRPSAFEIGPPKDSDDINDIRDYYLNGMTKTRALTRIRGAPMTRPQDDFSDTYQPASMPVQDDGYEMDQLEPTRLGTADIGYNDPDMGYNPLPYQPQHQHQYQQQQQVRPELDDSTKYLIDRARTARSKPAWEDKPKVSRYNTNTIWDRDSGFERPDLTSVSSVQRPPEESMMSSKTRSLLDKLKESTAALQDMSIETDTDIQQPGRQRKTSRFLKRRDTDSSYETSRPRSQGPDQQSSTDIGRMADGILGEGLYPIRDNPSSQVSSAYRSAGRRPSYQSSLETDRFSDRSSPDGRVPLRQPRRAQDEDEDLDAMINDLKQKTSGRDMYKIVGDIEGDYQTKKSLGRKSVSPPPRTRRRDDEPVFAPRSAMPQQQQQQQAPQGSNYKKYDPYDQIRGGTGFNFDFESRSAANPQARQQQANSYYQPEQLSYANQQQQQQSQFNGNGYSSTRQQPMLDPYGYGGGQVPAMNYGGYQQQQQQQQQPYGYQPSVRQMPPPQANPYGRRQPPPTAYGYYN
jgi:hypothetical protein